MKYQLSLHGKEVTMILTPQQKLERAHVRLLDSNDLRFFGSIAMFGKTEISERLPTAGTNGIDTCYNPNFIDGLSDKELLFVVLHENMHKAYKHAITWKHLSDEDPLLANMAMDYVINLELYDMDKHQRLIKMPKGGLIDEKFRGMDTQQVYDILKKENEEGKHTPNININQGEGCEGSEDDSQNAGDSGTECTDDIETDNTTPSEQTDNDIDLSNYADSIQQRAKDMELDSHDFDGEALSDEELEQMNEQLDEAIRQSAQMAPEGNGNLNRKIKELLEVKTPWQDLLADFMHTHCSKGNDITCFRRYNRRLIGSDIIMPSARGENMGDVVIAVDTSGSIDEGMIQRFLSEVSVITDDVLPAQVHLIYWDTAVCQHEVYDETDYEMMHQMTKPMGGGGTNVRCVLDYTKDKISLESDIECMLILTDGYVGYLDEEWNNVEYPILWAISPDGMPNFNPSNGQVIQLDKE